MKGRPRFYVEAEGPDVEAVRLGFKWLAKAAARSGATEAILAIPTKQNLWGTVFTEALGEPAAKALNAGRPVSLKTGVALKLVTHRMSLYPQAPTPVVCVYTSKAFLDKVDATHNVSEMCVVPWIMDEVQPWIETWAPVELSGKAPPPPPLPSLHPVLEQALLSLTGRVNLETGVSHPSDRSAATEMFRLLRKHRIPFDPEEVHRWLVAEGGWRPRHADHVKKIAERVRRVRRVRLGGPSWDENVVQVWRERASAKRGE
jgi:hypothetical protein